MKRIINTYRWRDNIDEVAPRQQRVNDDLLLFDDYKLNEGLFKPFIVNDTTALLCLEGEIVMSINMQEYKAAAPCLFVMLQGQIFQYHPADTPKPNKFMGVVMSQKFTDNLFAGEKVSSSLFQSFYQNPVRNLDNESLKAMSGYFSLLKDCIAQISNPYRLETAKHLTLAMFYGFGYTHEKELSNTSGRKGQISDLFLEQLRYHYKKEHSGAFYADRLNISLKYLSQTVKRQTGKTVATWIEEYVCTAAKALLLSGKMTVQQIAYEFNFESQSLFYKYFKRVTGLSPSDYRKRVK